MCARESEWVREKVSERGRASVSVSVSMSVSVCVCVRERERVSECECECECECGVNHAGGATRRHVEAAKQSSHQRPALNFVGRKFVYKSFHLPKLTKVPLVL